MTSLPARLFIGFPIPQRQRRSLAVHLERYSGYVESRIPQERWHITVSFLGEVEEYEQYLPELSKPLIQSFVPTCSITHIGQGKKHTHIWAYIHATQSLQALKERMDERIRSLTLPVPDTDRPFVPHISLAHISPVTPSIGVPDTPILETFTPPNACIYRSVQTEEGVRYVKEANIPLSVRALHE